MVKLERFLREKKVLTKFKKNFKKNYREFPLTPEEWFLDESKFICAFVFSETPEGFHFWSDLCREYNNYNQ